MNNICTWIINNYTLLIEKRVDLHASLIDTALKKHIDRCHHYRVAVSLFLVSWVLLGCLPVAGSDLEGLLVVQAGIGFLHLGDLALHEGVVCGRSTLGLRSSLGGRGCFCFSSFGHLFCQKISLRNKL